MPEYLAPGVYIEETSAGARPIEGVPTSIAAFLGEAERGPEAPRPIASFSEYRRWYGGYLPERSFLADAVQGFFDNGGQRCVVARLASREAALLGVALGNLQVMAIGRGSWAGNIWLKVDAATERDLTPENAAWFRLTVLYHRTRPSPFIDPTDPAAPIDPAAPAPDVLEVFDNLSHEPGAANDVLALVNNASHLVRVAWNADGAAPVPDRAGDWLGGEPAADPAIDLADFQGDELAVAGVADDLLGRGRGLAAIAQLDEVALLCAPDTVHGALDITLREAMREAAIDQCEALKDRFAVLALPQGLSDPSQAAELASSRGTSYGATYYPWLEVPNLATGGSRFIPATGHIAGVIARTDLERGVHKAPANQRVRGAIGLEFPVSAQMTELLSPRGVNCIRDFRASGRGIRVWGGRTMSRDPEWKYVNIRRLLLYLEESIDEGTQWAVFEPNDASTWAAVTRAVEDFLFGSWRSGALVGQTPDQAFFVKCDRSTMTQDDIDNGRLVCLVGVAPLRPAEFVIFRICQRTAQARA